MSVNRDGNDKKWLELQL